MNKSNQDTGYLHSVETFGALDGPGIRYVLFLQGCPLRCGFCHNPDTWQACTGKAVTPEDAFEDILKYKNFISSGGVTLSGGEPLLQPEFCQALESTALLIPPVLSHWISAGRLWTPPTFFYWILRHWTLLYAKSLPARIIKTL